MQVLKLDNVKKYYGVNANITKAVDGISFLINEGEFVAIMGASGSGKTTLLNCISTIDVPTSGFITIGGIEITKIKEDEIADFRKNNLGFIFQDFNLLDTLTCFENIALALTIQKVKPREIQNRVKKAVETMTGLNVVEVNVHVQGVNTDSKEEAEENKTEE